MVLDISTLFIAARAMGRVLFIIGVGSAAAQSGLLDKPARSCLANFNLNLFFPALYLSVAGHYGAYDLIRYAPLWIGSLLHIVLGYGLALVTARLFGLQQQDKTFLLIMTAFGNCGGLPFVLMQAVCASSWEPVADMHEPVARAFVMMCARRPCVRRAQPLVAVACRCHAAHAGPLRRADSCTTYRGRWSPSPWARRPWSAPRTSRRCPSRRETAQQRAAATGSAATRSGGHGGRRSTMWRPSTRSRPPPSAPPPGRARCRARSPSRRASPRRRRTR